MSAKHIAAVKDTSKKNKGGSKGGSAQKSINSNTKKAHKEEEDQDPPEVMEALATFRKVEKAAKENPGIAAPILWKIAKALWTFRQSLETGKALSLLIRTLSELQVSIISSSGSSAMPGSLSPTQISMTLYLSRLAIARLIVYVSPSLAAQYYLDAIHGRWQIEYEHFQTINEMVNTTSITQLLDYCKRLISENPKTEKLLVAPVASTSEEAAVRKPVDPNLKLFTILFESASMLAQRCNMSSFKSTQKTLATEDKIQGETALKCYALAAVLSSASGDNLGTLKILRRMAIVYKHLRMSFFASACLIYAGELVLAEESPREYTDNDNDVHSPVWDLFQALLLAMETGDFVRMQTATRLLNNCCEMEVYQDVETVVKVANAVITQDNDYLYNGASYALEHLILLVQEARNDQESKVKLLLCFHSTPAASIETLTRSAPSNVAITLLEGSKRTGGWLQSDRISDPENPGGSILLERGPRSLRPQGISGLNTLEMIKLLGLEPKLEPVLKTSPAAKNRFIYSRKKLHMLPSSLTGALTHTLLAPKIPRASLDLIKSGSGEEDESIESFVSRRFGKGFSDDLISAVVHGIYAGDVSKLSVRSTFGTLYHLEKEYRSVVMGLMMGGGTVETPWDIKLKEKLTANMPELNEFLKLTSIYSFTDGLEELSDKLEQDIIKSGRVTIHKDSLVEKLDFDKENKSAKASHLRLIFIMRLVYSHQLWIKDQEPLQTNIVISAIPPRQLYNLLPKPHSEMIYNPSVTVAVVNLVYPAEQARLASPGFGYLIPRSENSAINHQGLLGVVFDSCSIPSQDLGPSRDKKLKLTAMIGGHMFKDIVADQASLRDSDTSSANIKSNDKSLKPFFEKTAIDAVKKHLGIDAAPEIIKVHIRRECIPQYLVGHIQRMQVLDETLREEYEGMLAVTGAGYLGVSVNDCIKNAREVSEAIVSKLDEVDDGEAELVGMQDTVTGLERSWFM
ncbi:hypothetical protein BGZ46_003365 [Entomortierella lignicola]|nr:hypothetical protein BGZ46_003365 [Entomortierella lignicola]